MTTDSRDMAAMLAAAGPRRNRRGRLVAAAIVIALGAAGAWYLFGASTATVIYDTDPAARGDLTVTVSATGTVQPTTQVEISSELSGTLASVEVDFNDIVAVGQPLARLDDTKLKAQVANAEASHAAAVARVEQAKATLDEAEVNYQSQVELDRRGVTTQQKLVADKAAYDRARAAVGIATADLTLAEANLALIRADLSKAVIRSPINGIVLDRAADAGQIVASSLSAPTLFTLAEDLSRMDLLVNIDEADIGQVAVGNTAVFTVDAFDAREFPAQIVSVRYAPETTEGVVTYKAVLTIDNADLSLRPGMTATATITVAEVPGALTVANGALRYAPPQIAEETGGGGGLLGLIMPRRPAEDGPAADAGRVVWVLRDGQPVRVPVTVGATDGRRSVILSGELAEGEPVIIDQRTAN